MIFRKNLSGQFADRAEAGKMLAERLENYRGTNSIVLAVPRGGVPVGYEVARVLQLPLDIALSKEIGHPLNPEFAIGSVSPGSVIVDPATDASPAYISRKTKEIRELLAERAIKYRGGQPEPELKGKIILLVDDGIATGNTILALIRMLREKEPAKIVVAVPLAPADGCGEIRKEADEFICLLEPDYFPGVGAFYEEFLQVDDKEVVRLLQEAASSAAKISNR